MHRRLAVALILSCLSFAPAWAEPKAELIGTYRWEVEAKWFGGISGLELASDDHPVSQLATLRADDERLRQSSLAELRRLAREHADEIELFGYHDFTEFPRGQVAAVRAAESH